VRKEVPHRRSLRAGLLVEVDDPLLGGHQDRDRGGELRDRCPRKFELLVARNGLDTPRHRDRRVVARPRPNLRESLHGAETNGVERQLISSGAAFEDRVGYSRAVRVGSHVWISGTAPIMPNDADPPDDAFEQARICLEIVASALSKAGATLDDVVRTRIYLTDASLIDDVGRAHRAAFGTARPATTGIVTQLLDPRWLVEIEAEAYVA
jgi:enamine deaminase RidA (YjgF/YER057c/UK114 family)